ncbi:MAG: hypothetical protein AAF665_03125 [Pseudomonadota bacterium]
MIRWILWRISDHGRLALIAGLTAGLGLPKLAAALQPWLPQMIAVLLTLTALRIGHRAALDALVGLRQGLTAIVVLQLGLPLLLLGLCWVLGFASAPVALAVVCATAAPTISGAVNLSLMLGQNAGRMMQILVLGTALFPLTVLPLLLLMPQMGAPEAMLRTALSLLAVIFISGAVGFAIRATVFPNPSDTQIKSLDGLSVLAFSVTVIGLMAALNPALRADPVSVLWWTVLAFAVGYGAQIVTYQILRGSAHRAIAGPLALGAGNRNIALFLVALPAEVMAPVMVFVGCWQLPMYLTPLMMRWLYTQDAPSE